MTPLSDEQRQALHQTGGCTPVPVYDPQTGRTYFLVPGELYERVRGQVERPAPAEQPAAEEGSGIPPGIRRSKEAFLRDLPELMRSWWYRYSWVAYHGEERIGISRNPEKLIRKCRRRGLKRDEYYLGVIRHHEPEPEEIDQSLYEFDEIEEKNNSV